MAYNPGADAYPTEPTQSGYDWDLRSALQRNSDIAQALGEANQHLSIEQIVLGESAFMHNNPHEYTADYLFQTLLGRQNTDKIQTNRTIERSSRSMSFLPFRRKADQSLETAHALVPEEAAIRDTIILLSFALLKIKPRAIGVSYDVYNTENDNYERERDNYATAIINLAQSEGINLRTLLREQRDPAMRDGLIGRLMDKLGLFR